MPEILLTVDVDWAPDCAIDHLADELVAHRIRATWFVTHPSQAITRLTDVRQELLHIKERLPHLESQEQAKEGPECVEEQQA